MIKRLKISLDDRDVDDATVLTFIEGLAGLSKARRGEAMRRLLHKAIRSSAEDIKGAPSAPRIARAAETKPKPVARAAVAMPAPEPARAEITIAATEPVEPPIATPEPVEILAPASDTPQRIKKPSLTMW